MKIGYARVSTNDQNLNRQLDQLFEYGCERIFQEKITGSQKERPELERMIDILRNGDTVVITESGRQQGWKWNWVAFGEGICRVT